MHSLSRLIKKLLFVILLFSILFGSISKVFPSPAFAVPSPTPSPSPTPASGMQLGTTTNATWAFDPEVTEVGKNADRARQLLWWVFTHPAVHSAGVLAEVWSVSRNIVYIFIVLVIVAFGVGIILSRRSSMGSVFAGISSPFSSTNLPSLFYKIGGILLFVTFSYVLVVGMIQMSEVTMRFFIENVGGKDLFNVVFAGAGNSEENYMTFVGYRDINPLNREMVDTSLFIVRITSFTYYIMALIMILRTIILWFLLVVSPFLALLMPFVFIRNVGWIWIGVFFQWIFYGPLVALFLATLTKIWVSGIPFPFDFTRANCIGAGNPLPACTGNGQIYRTAINILYGGPAQTLAAGNSGNYIDTYAEYIIALVMLWAAIILPWLLLRIFRDYCCGAIAASNATLSGIFDRIRQYPTPPPPQPAKPSTTAGMAVELPFRQRVEEKIREVTHTNIENITEVNRTNTTEIARALDAHVSSLSDVSRFELNDISRSQVQQNLQKLSAPERITSTREREQFESIRSALETRAASGDRVAQTLLTATNTEKSKEVFASSSSVSTSSTSTSGAPVAEISMVGGRSQFAAPRSRGGYAPTMPQIIPTTTGVNVFAQKATITTLTQKVGLSEEKIKEILKTLETVTYDSTQFTQTIAGKTGLTNEKVQTLFTSLTSVVGTNPVVMDTIAQKSGVHIQKIKEILTILSTTQEPNVQMISHLCEQTKLTETQVRDVLSVVSSSVLVASLIVSEIAKKSTVTEKKVTEVISLIPQMTSQKSPVETVAQKLGVSAAQVAQVAQFVKATSGFTKGPAKQTKVVSMGGKDVPSQVSLEDYEEVKNMWLKHYRASPVPISGTIANRGQWLENDMKKLTNISHLIGSSNPQLKQKGLDEIAEILPFLLLGGFSDVETCAYVKAKLEAAKQVADELAVVEKAKQEGKSEALEEEETLLTVDEKKKKQEKADAVSEGKVMKEEKKE